MRKASDDLAYVRNALERQRRLSCEIMPIWFVAFVGSYLISNGVLKDLWRSGVIGEGMKENLGDITGVLVFFALLFLAYRARKARKEENITRPDPTSSEYWFILAPVLLLIGGVGYAIALGKGLDVPGEFMRPFILSQLAFSLMFVGYRMMKPVFWFGVGFALAGIPMFLFPDLTPYPNTLFAATASGFFLFGAFRQRKFQKA